MKILMRYLLFLPLLIPVIAFAQKKVTLSGYIRDSKSSETLISATVALPEIGIGAQTNTYGFYSISAPPGKYAVVFAYAGYATRTDTIDLSNSVTYNAD